MGKCQNCGKETKGSKKFCCRACYFEWRRQHPELNPFVLKKEQIKEKNQKYLKDPEYIKRRVKSYIKTCDIKRGGTAQEIQNAREIEKYGQLGLSSGQKVSYTHKLRDQEGKYEETKKRIGLANHLNAESRMQKTRQTNLKKYGVKCLLEDSTRKKAGMQRKYGVDNPSQSAEIMKQKEERLLKRKGYKNVYNDPQVIENCKKASQSTETLAKRKKACLERYGVEYPFQSEEILRKGLGATFKRHSYINDDFENLLKSAKIIFEREFSINRKFYDFKVGSILIEINPTITHNSTVGRHVNPKSKEYHLNKTNLAIKKGYNCICVWDWTDKEDFVNWLKENQFAKFIQSEVETLPEPIKIQLGKTLVDIYTDGQPFYRDLVKYEN